MAAGSLYIAASILFTEDEIGTYVRWQLQQPGIPQARHYAIPTALEYADFIHWRHELRNQWRASTSSDDFFHMDSISTSASSGNGNTEKGTQALTNEGKDSFELAEKCKHSLHPVLPALFASLKEMNGSSPPRYPSPPSEGELPHAVEPLQCLRCPVCTVRMHLTFIEVILARWALYGGPWRENPIISTGLDGIIYDACRKAYHRAKTDMINSGQEFENWAVAEQRWESSNSSVDLAAVKPFSAGEGVRVFRSSMKFFPGAIDENTASQDQADKRTNLSTTAPSTVPQPKKPEKKLTWTSDTPLETRHTPSHQYHRPSTFWYNPSSPHSCLDEEGWNDTSHMHDHLFVLSQCRILRLVWSPGAEYMTYDDLNTTITSPTGSIIQRFGDNAHVRRLQAMVMGWVDTLQESEKWIEYLRTTADIFLVLKRDWSAGDEFDRFKMVTSLNSPGLRTYAKLMGDVDENEEEPVEPIVIGGNVENVDVGVMELEGDEWEDADEDAGSMDVDVGQEEGSEWVMGAGSRERVYRVEAGS